MILVNGVVNECSKIGGQGAFSFSVEVLIFNIFPVNIGIITTDNIFKVFTSKKI